MQLKNLKIEYDNEKEHLIIKTKKGLIIFETIVNLDLREFCNHLSQIEKAKESKRAIKTLEVELSKTKYEKEISFMSIL